MTKGKPFIVDYKNNNDHSFLLRIAASLEKESRHPIANTLIQEAKKQNLSLFPIKEISLIQVEAFLENLIQLMELSILEVLNGYKAKE